MRAEVELTKQLGFNSIRIHQKVEDPRYIYWCDVLGLTVWAEAAAAYEFSPRAVELYSAEWARIVRSQHSHPSVIAWVPFNESWGIQHVAHDPAQQAYSRALTELTRALDPSRPVISNDGWEHTDSDIMTVHDYESDGAVLSERYGTRLEEMLGGLGGPGRRMNLGESGDAPVMLTEFGGVQLGEGGWGYSSATSTDGFRDRLTEIFAAVHGSPTLAGFCYTQLADTGQESNGLCDENRVPKLPVEVIRGIVTGRSEL
jgi:beta-galactosidase/beta-glucuronidase